MTITLADLCLPNAGQVKLEPDTLVDYFDISSVDNISKTVKCYETYSFAEAPSRARKAVRKNSILVSTVRPNLNAVAVFQEETANTPVVSTGFCVLDCKENVNPRFVFNFCRSKAFIDDMVSQATGASYPAVSEKIVRSAKVPQYSREKQNEIAQVLDSVSLIIDARKQELQKLDELVKARFVEMFGDESNPMNWPVVDVEDVADVQVGVVIKPAQYYTDAENGVKTFRSLNIGSMYIKDTDWVYFTEEGNQKNQKSILKENDLLIVRSGAPGAACVVTSEYSGCNAVDIIIAHPNLAKVNPYYLAQYTNLPHGKRQIDEGTGGAAQQHFNVGKYNKLQLMLPPLEKQNEFEQFLKQLDKSKVVVQKALDEAQLLFDNLMQQYFG